METVVITGLGIVSPYGEGSEVFRKNWMAGASAIKKRADFKDTAYRREEAAIVADFNPREALGTRKLRLYDRATLMAMVSSQFLMMNLGLLGDQRLNTAYSPEEIGIILGTYGSIKSTIHFDMEVAREPRHVVPSIFPNTIMNAAASYVAIRFNCRALSTTISNGETSSLDALGLAHNLLTTKHASFFMVGAVEELSEHFSILKQKKMDYHGLDNPILGEGSCMFSLELEQAAQQRGAAILADILAFSNVFCPDLELAIEHNLKQIAANVGAPLFEEIQHVFGAESDLVEDRKFYKATARYHRTRDRLGYSCSAHGSFQLTAALLDDSIASGSLVLLNNVSLAGNCASLLIRKR